MELDRELGAMWHVVVGEAYSTACTVEVTPLIAAIHATEWISNYSSSFISKVDCVHLSKDDQLVQLFHGSLAITMWKCGANLLKEQVLSPLTSHSPPHLTSQVYLPLPGKAAPIEGKSGVLARMH